MTMMTTTKDVTIMMTMVILMILAIVMIVITVKMVVMVQLMPAVKMKPMTISVALREMRSQKNKNCHRKSIHVAKRDKE